MGRCVDVDVEMWRCGDVKECRCGVVEMWVCGDVDVEMSRCGDGNV